jgi:hypothetical protein
MVANMQNIARVLRMDSWLPLGLLARLGLLKPVGRDEHGNLVFNIEDAAQRVKRGGHEA